MPVSTVGRAVRGTVGETMRGKAFLDLLDRFLVDGSIEFVMNGQSRHVGNSSGRPPDAVIRVEDAGFLDEVLVTGNLALGEAYMRGDFRIDGDDVAGFIGVLLRNHLDEEVRKHLGMTMTVRMAAIRLANRVRGRVGNIHKHFDIGNDLYEAFLDSSLAYTCGYEAGDGTSDLEQLQAQKYARIARKLRLEEGDRVADLGCGFGGLLIHCAQNHGIIGKGLTISRKQAEKANERIAEKGLADRIRVEYASYETLTGTYDKIVSVGMMEHLTDAEYPVCVSLIGRRLTRRAEACCTSSAATVRRATAIRSPRSTSFRARSGRSSPSWSRSWSTTLSPSSTSRTWCATTP